MFSSLFRSGSTPLSQRLKPALDDLPAPDKVLTMITEAERRALSHYAQTIWSAGARRDGLIIDGGSFVGASTLALAEGLSRSDLAERERLERIWSYDLFLTTPGMAKYFGPSGPAAGESFRPVYDANIAPFANYIRVCEGDIRQGPFPDRSVALLFLDILWNWDATDAVGRAFYPRLEPGRSLLIHQDFVYPYYPWIILSMGLLKSHLRFAYIVPLSSAVFEVVKPIRPRDVEDVRDMPLQAALDIYDEFLAVLNGWERGSVGLGKAMFLASRNKVAEARAIIEAVVAAHKDEPLVQQYVDPVTYYCDQTELRGVAKPLDQLAGKPMRQSFAEDAPP